MSTDYIYVWRNDEFVACCDFATTPPLVADSYLVVDGAVRAWPWHRERFMRMASAHVTSTEALRVWNAAAAQVPRSGRWWPRLELRLNGNKLDFTLRLRPPPPWPATVRLWPAPLDPRTYPRIKGPDLERLEQLQAQARAAGGDEALLVGPDGYVREAGYAALAWWRGGRLHVVDTALPTLASVTRRVLLAAAAAANIEVVVARPRLQDFHGTETWLLSSGAGLRPVVQWLGVGVSAAPAKRYDTWLRRLNAWRMPLP